MMRFSLAVSVVIVAIAMSGFAQQNTILKVKPSPPEKPAKPSAAPIGGPASAASANARSLASIEHQTAKASVPRAAKKTPGALKPVKDKPNQPINFGGTNGGKRVGTTNQGASSYNGRLKQKGGGVHQ